MVTLNEIQIRVAEAINQSGISQTEIARRLGVKQSQISCYVHAKKMPALDTFANLCAVLDVSADEILGLKDESGKKISVTNSFNNFSGNGNNIKF